MRSRKCLLASVACAVALWMLGMPSSLRANGVFGKGLADAGCCCKERDGKPGGAKDHGKGAKGDNGVGNGLDPQPRGNPPLNDGPGAGPGNPGNKGGPGGQLGNRKSTVGNSHNSGKQDAAHSKNSSTHNKRGAFAAGLAHAGHCCCDEKGNGGKAGGIAGSNVNARANRNVTDGVRADENQGMALGTHLGKAHGKKKHHHHRHHHRKKTNAFFDGLIEVGGWCLEADLGGNSFAGDVGLTNRLGKATRPDGDNGVGQKNGQRSGGPKGSDGGAFGKGLGDVGHCCGNDKGEGNQRDALGGSIGNNAGKGNSAGKGGRKGNNGVGNGIDPQPPGNPRVNDGPGTGPGNPGNKGGPGVHSVVKANSGGNGKGGPKGNNGVGNGIDPQPPGNPRVNDGVGTRPGSPGNKGGPGGKVGTETKTATASRQGNTPKTASQSAPKLPVITYGGGGGPHLGGSKSAGTQVSAIGHSGGSQQAGTQISGLQHAALNGGASQMGGGHKAAISQQVNASPGGKLGHARGKK